MNLVRELERAFFQHYIIELFGVPMEACVSIESLDDRAKRALDELKLKIVSNSFYKFDPVGITITYVLATSHCSIHTWPEINYIHVDLLTCTDTIDKIQVKKAMEKNFQPNKIRVYSLNY